MRTKSYLTIALLIWLISCKDISKNQNGVTINQDSLTLEFDKKGDTGLSNLITKINLDSGFALNIKTSISKNTDSIDNFKNSSRVSEQDLIFFKNDTIISKIKIDINGHGIKNVKNNLNRYTIKEVAIDKIVTTPIYVLYLFAANGEAEYYYYYNQIGKLLFYQKCDRIKCTIKCFEFDEKTATKYCSNKVKLKFIDVNSSFD